MKKPSELIGDVKQTIDNILSQLPSTVTTLGEDGVVVSKDVLKLLSDAKDELSKLKDIAHKKEEAVEPPPAA